MFAKNIFAEVQESEKNVLLCIFLSRGDPLGHATAFILIPSAWNVIIQRIYFHSKLGKPKLYMYT